MRGSVSGGPFFSQRSTAVSRSAQRPAGGIKLEGRKDVVGFKLAFCGESDLPDSFDPEERGANFTQHLHARES